jgi:hypothetical protein
MLRRKAGMAAAAAARVVPVAAVAVAVRVGAVAVAVQVVAAAPRVAVAVVRVQVAAAAAAAPAARVAAAAVRVEAVTAAVKVQVAGMARAAAAVEVRAEAVRVAERTAVAPKVADVIVRVITTRRLLLVTATVIGTAIGTETATWFVIETEIETETVIVIERKIVIETETVIETGEEILAAAFANGNAIASVTKGGGENVSVAAPSIPRVCICRRITAAMDTAQTRMSKAIRTACTQARTMRAGGRVTIRAAHTFTSMAPADFYPSSAVQLRTARPIAMVFCADMKRGTSATKCISPADAFIDSAV